MNAAAPDQAQAPPVDRKAFSAARWRFLDALARAKVEHVEFRIAYLIVSRINHGNGKRYAFPSLETLAEESGCSRSTAKRAVHNLVAGGWIVRQRIGGGKLASEYRLDWGRWLSSAHPSAAEAEMDDLPF